jgi:predicted DNA-binding transcriptional regulator AlpA
MAIGRIGRPADVRARLGLSRPTIDRIEHHDPTFPRRIRLGRAAVGWDLDAIDAWLETRPRGPKSPSLILSTHEAACQRASQEKVAESQRYAERCNATLEREADANDLHARPLGATP